MFNFFRKKYKYGILIHSDKNLFVFDDGDKIEEYEDNNLVEVLNKLGSKGWELEKIDPAIGFIFKR